MHPCIKLSTCLSMCQLLFPNYMRLRYYHFLLTESEDQHLHHSGFQNSWLLSFYLHLSLFHILNSGGQGSSYLCEKQEGIIHHVWCSILGLPLRLWTYDSQRLAFPLQRSMPTWKLLSGAEKTEYQTVWPSVPIMWSLQEPGPIGAKGSHCWLTVSQLQ